MSQYADVTTVKNVKCAIEAGGDLPLKTGIMANIFKKSKLIYFDSNVLACS